MAGCFNNDLLFAFAIAFLLLLVSPVFGQELRSVDWVGIERKSDVRAEVFRDRLPPLRFNSRSELTLEIQRIQRETLGALARDGFYFARIDSLSYGSDTSSVDLSVHVATGLRYVLKQIVLTGDSLPANVAIESELGSPINSELLEADIDRMLSALEREGRPLAKVYVADASIEDSNGLVITLRVERNGAARIGRITVDGNTTTRANVIIREFGLREGELLIPAKLESGQAALERLGYFGSVESPKIFLQDDSTVEVRIVVEEARTTSIDAVLGYNPPRIPNESGYISGLVDLGFRNIAGTARDAAVHYSSLSKGTQRLSAAYREPWLFRFPLHLHSAFDQYQQDTSYVSTQMQAGLTYSLTQSLDVTASILYDRIIPTDLPEQPFIAFNSRKLLTLLSSTYDSRDELLSPVEGLLLRLSGNYGSKNLNGPDRFLSDSISRSSTLSEIALDLNVFQPTFSRKLVLALGIHAKRTAVFGSALDQSDLTRLGGARTLRGYRENELLASRYAYVNFEYRFLTARHSYLFLFTDAGWLERGPIIGDNFTVRSTPFSYGLGVQQSTPVGILSLSIGLSKSESFDRAKVHFGLLTRI